ncbi:MAG: T9SS type A sorting domain-containing protein [Gemmatimonadetes bacterium]|jgi:hypothetical protein|nr:T9SS type A sorting domain-containing protein [Gemmatimonadota bacterium]MBT4612637.1 T9SS type A sorting domain-containing protein [Gemmatimonadota bacterium]MBT5056026.1 T9SS type A sorting domain-containing protein [Gemmatimonadota bacterium]MBT5143212.1 T9SS type A sorting domain-containing protein [Gemmatimonadota bacterium]MBT5586854.1 T9SS type A sorting domain-containing protein [Gemmatimonadota bacterium]
MMRLRRGALLTLALSLALISGAFAGNNAGVTFSLSGSGSVANVGPGEQITLEVTASGLDSVKQIQTNVKVSDASHFDLTSTSISGLGAMQSAFDLLGGLVNIEDPTVFEMAGSELSQTSPGTSGDLTFTVTVTTSASFTTDDMATVSFESILLAFDKTVDSDVFDADALSNLTVTVNPPVSDPVLSATSATDVSADYSAVGSGAGSDGEVEISVSFADASGAAASGQSIAFDVTNNGSESITIDGAELAAGSSTTVNVDSDAGSASILLDAEGGPFAGSTSASVSATTSADNSEGATLELSADFSVTWDVPVPAELADFGGSVTPQSQVVLAWAVPSQSNNLGWEVFRSVDNEAFDRVGDMVTGEGTVNEFRTYEFLDEELPAADFVYYYLRQVDFDGSAARSQTIEVALASVQVLPTTMSLAQNFPNPFNPETTIRFDIATEASVSVRIFDITGQVVRTLVSDSRAAGSYTELWDGRTDAGVRVGSGVYFYELKAGSFTSMKKMTFVQ